MPAWTFITSHGAVLRLVASQPQITARAIAAELGITERSVLRIIGDLEGEGHLRRTREGRVNRYRVNYDLPLRGPALRDIVVGELLKVVTNHRLEGQEPSSDDSTTSPRLSGRPVAPTGPARLLTITRPIKSVEKEYAML
jgi:DNA-binding Lrp family transcriptional regulator